MGPSTGLGARGHALLPPILGKEWEMPKYFKNDPKEQYAQMAYRIIIYLKPTNFYEPMSPQ